MNFPLSKDQYEFLRPIGKGGTAIVFEARCLANNQHVAVKVVDLEQCPIEIDILRQETAFWSKSVHPNVVQYHGSFINGHFLYILMEYMAGGSIAEIMRYSAPHGFKNEVYIATILKELLTALDYFHENHQIHRDVKSGNILMNENGEIKIGDFGVSANLLEEGQRKRARFTVIGTPCYMAPEVLKEDGGYTESADIWSLGITAIELAQGSPPYATLYPLEVMVKILENPPPTLPDGDFSAAFKDFVKCCLQSSPDKRKTAKQLLTHKFLKKTIPLSQLNKELLVPLPSLADRFARLNQAIAQKGIEIFDKAPPSKKLEWDLGIEPSPAEHKDETKQIKKGKFTITTETKTSEPKTVLEPTKTPEPSTCPEDSVIKSMQQELENLRSRAEALERDNAKIKDQMSQLIETVKTLMGKK